jgi:hypothetical protein
LLGDGRVFSELPNDSRRYSTVVRSEATEIDVQGSQRCQVG